MKLSELYEVNSLVITVVTMFPWDVVFVLGLVTEELANDSTDVDLEADVR